MVVDVLALGGEQFFVHGAKMVSEASHSLLDLRGESDGKVGTREPIDNSDMQGFEIQLHEILVRTSS